MVMVGCVMVLDNCQCQRVLLIWIVVGQSAGVCGVEQASFGHLSLPNLFSFTLSLGDSWI